MIDLNGTLLAQIINFLLLVFILRKFAYGPLLNMLAERQAKIQASLDTAEQERLAAQQLRQDYLNQLAAARAEAQAIVEKAALLAEQAKEQILQEAREESARLMQKSQEDIARERQLAMLEFKSQAAALAVAAAGKIIAQQLDDQMHERLVTEFIDQLDDQKIGGLPC